MDNTLCQLYAVSRANIGPIGPYLSGYVAFLQNHRYSTQTIKRDLQTACTFSRWLDRRKISLHQISDQTLENYWWPAPPQPSQHMRLLSDIRNGIPAAEAFILPIDRVI
jgi:hypothetical protein